MAGGLSKEEPFVFRLEIPDGYRVPPHTHPKVERITVLAGTFLVGMGDKFNDKEMKSMTAGTYGLLAGKDEALRLRQGRDNLAVPWGRAVEYVNPSDDPRKK